MRFQPEPGVIRWRLHLASPPERVWTALATDEGRARYWAERSEERDGAITFHFTDFEPSKGRILAAKPLRRFAVEYFGTRTDFELNDDGSGGTELSLTCSAVPEDCYWEMVAGWVSVLLAMKAAVDHGVDLRNHDPKRSWQTGYADN